MFLDGKFFRRIWLPVLSLWLSGAMAQSPDELLEAIDATRRTETAAVVEPAVEPVRDTLASAYFTQINNAAGIRRPRIHPYFRDEYWVMRDLRRLVQTVAPAGLNGYETVEDLVEIGQQLPIEKQTTIVKMAIAGGAANVLSGETNRQLRKWKIRSIRWDLDRVFVRQQYRNLISMTLYKGYSADGVNITLPRIKTQYSLYMTEYYKIHRFTYWIAKPLGLSFSTGSNRHIYSASILPGKNKRLYLSYYPGIHLVNTYLELRSDSFLIYRLYYSRYFWQESYPVFRGEIIVHL